MDFYAYISSLLSYHMNKLISYLIGLAVTIAIMYVVGFIIASIIAVFILAINRYIAYKNSKIEYTKWEFDSEYPPRLTFENGETYFQNVTYVRRYNRFKKQWEFEKRVDPTKRPIDQATSLSDKFYIMKRFQC